MLRAGHPERARPCLLCNQTCQVRDNRNPIVTCVGDPRSGHETTDPDPEAPAQPAPTVPGVRRCWSSVAGRPGWSAPGCWPAPAGRSDVAERTGPLGGALALAAVGAGRDRLRRLTDWLAAECTRLGRGCRGLGVDVDAGGGAGRPGRRVGGGPGHRLPSFSRPVPRRTATTPPVIDALTLLREGAGGLPDGPVVIDDPVGGPVGIGVAEWLAATGRPVTLVSPDPVAGTLLSRTGDLADANVRLQRAGVARQLRARITGSPAARTRASSGASTSGPARAFRLPAGLLVDCGHRLPDDALYQSLGDPTVPRAGDCVAPRTVHEAVLEGRRAALALLGAPASPPAGRGGPMSGAGQYRQLFTPLRVGPLTLANRIVFSAHLTNYATEDGRPSEQHAAYYAARAAGGAGLIITEEHSTHPTDWPYEKLIHGFHAEVIPGYRRITEAVHRHGVPILAQINHNGGQASSMYTRLPVWAPSPVPDPLFREVPKAVEPHEIAEIVDGYARVAGHCMAGGFDGVELQCSHSSIVRGFLSPATNHRTDGYGGGLPQRARLLLELVAAVRDAIGPAAALGVRLCGDELIEGGTTIEDAVEVARHGRGHRPGRLHQHVHRGGHGHACT